jgi:hypothetical protein
MVWRAETDIVICEDCAGNIKDGFCADLIHLAALRQLRDFIRPGQFTLSRESIRDLEDRDRSILG